MGQEAQLQSMWSRNLRTPDRRQSQDKHQNHMWTRHPFLLKKKVQHAAKSFNIQANRLLLPPCTAQ